MGKWLERLRNETPKTGAAELTKLTHPPSVGSVSASSGPFGDNEPEATCPTCNGARWWQDRAGGWWCERCQPWESGQWARLVELPQGERPTPPAVTEEEVEDAVATAERHGWSREAFREWCGGDWSALPEPPVLEAMLAVVAPHPNLSSEEVSQCTSES